MAKDTGPLGLIEPLMDRGLQEDVPKCLAAIRRAAEGLSGAAASASDVPRRQIQTFDELQAQLTMLYGEVLVMPRHKELVAAGRCASEAIVCRGGHPCGLGLPQFGLSGVIINQPKKDSSIL